MIFVDSNIPMYLVGADEGFRARARRLVERAIGNRDKLVTSAEVLQEILHRYAAIGRRDAIQPAFDTLLGITDVVFAIGQTEVERAKALLLARPRLSARDALHLATMERQRVTTILSFDAGFDGYPGVTRLGADE